MRNQCSKCVLDRSAKEITFDKEGVCCFCHQAQRALKEMKGEKYKLPEIIKQIKKDGKGKKFDCLVGMSGGVDSSTVLHEAVKLGLRCLVFTMDNGFNNSKADENVLRLIETLKVSLYRYVLDLEKFRELQSAYLRAGVINVEAVYDNLLAGATYEMADKHGIKWVLSGGNVSSESIMPASWSHRSSDLTNMKDIYYKMTGRRLKSVRGKFPLFGIVDFNYYKWIKRIKTMYLLDFLDYDRKKSEKMLVEKYGFQSTGEKHEENIFTKWFQNFYLFEKFGIDKRKAHLASLINSGQITHKEAIEILGECPIYPRLGFEERVMKYPKRKHEDFKIDPWFDRISLVVRTLRKWLL